MAQGQSNYSINLTNDGNGNYTAALLRNPTLATGGTSINSTVGNSMDLTIARNALGVAAQIALQLAVDDRAAGN